MAVEGLVEDVVSSGVIAVAVVVIVVDDGEGIQSYSPIIVLAQCKLSLHALSFETSRPSEHLYRIVQLAFIQE